MNDTNSLAHTRWNWD